MKLRSAVQLLCGMVLSGTVWAQTGTSEQALTLGVVPQYPAVELQRRWAPVVELVEVRCRVKVRMEFFPNIPSFEQGFNSGLLDLAYVNPYHAVMARRAQRYEPLVREGKEALTGILVVKADSAVRRMQDLQGATIAFPAPNAFGASLYMRALLEREHGIRFTPTYVKTHSNSYRHVIKGEALAAGGVRATLETEGEDIQKSLRVIYETPGASPHPLLAHPRVSPTVRQCVVSTLTSSELSDAQREALAGVQMPNPVKAVYARDYQPLEKLDLESYVVRTTP